MIKQRRALAVAVGAAMVALTAGGATGANASQHRHHHATRLKTTVRITAAPHKVVSGHRITLAATVRSKSHGFAGRVLFDDLASHLTLGSAKITRRGTAKLKVRLTAGVHRIVAEYTGDVRHRSSHTGAVALSVATPTLLSSETTLGNLTPNPALRGQDVTMSAWVGGNGAGPPTGYVSFVDQTSGAVLGTAPIDANDSVLLDTSTLAPGAYEVVASYLGDSTYSASTSNPSKLVIEDSPLPVTSTVVVTPSTTESTYDDSVSFTATVSGESGVATGSVTFADSNGSALAVQKLSGGQTTFTTRALAVGSRAITATYSGDQTYGSDTSSPAVVTVDPSAGGIASGVQLDSRHDGESEQSTLDVSHLGEKWTTTLSTDVGATTSYPLVADGRVFVIVGATHSQIYALDAGTGTVVWVTDPDTSYAWIGLTYDGGQVFAVDRDGYVAAFDAATGHRNWLARQGQIFIDSPPTAYDGVLYVAGTEAGGTLWAIRESDGVIEWGQGVENGDWSAPTVDDSGVYVSYACEMVYGFQLSGANKWFHDGDCEGGGGETSVLHNSSLYVSDSYGPTGGPLILSATDGSVQHTYTDSGDLPAFDGQQMYITKSTLDAYDPTGSTKAWSFAGDGSLTTPALTANGAVYVGSATGDIYALAAATGQQLWSATVPVSSYVVDSDVSLAIGDNLLVVPSDGTVTAFGN